MDRSEEEQEIVIVGAGICGLATALALHRKGVRSIVLERSETLRASGAGIGIWANGWRALEQLGVASDLRKTAVPIQRNDEARCLMRSDLIRTLADALPPGTIHFGCQIVSVKMDPSDSYPILQLLDGSFIVAKILIGCDGLNSVVANFLELKPTKEFSACSVRGLTNYPNGHAFPHELVRTRRNGIGVGIIPIDDKLVCWYVGQEAIREDHAKVSQRPELIRELILQSIDGFPTEVAQLIEDSELESLSLTRLRYRAPWDLLLGKFRKGTVTVAGDAMHVMGPFLGQGGSAALEDAIVLARCLSRKFVNPVDRLHNSERETMRMMHEVGEAMDQYVKERRMRVLRLSTQTYLIGSLLKPPSLLFLPGILMDRSEEEQEIVIVGAGICGLATALALHRKGVRSVVLERSETLRASGAGIGIWANGWRALEQLGVASDLRKTAVPIQRFRDVWLDKGSNQETPVNDEARCLMRSDLIRTLADALPPGTIHFGCQIVSVKMDPSDSYPILQLLDGSFIVAKILIGCDGLNSVVANFLELKPTKEFGACSVRGLTNYPNGHAFPHELVRTRRNGISVGIIPIDDKLMYWFVGQEAIPEDHAKVSQRPELIRELILQSIDGFPTEVAQLIEDSELESLSLTRLRYRAPWDLLLGKFRKGTVTVAGDAMHVMGPFLGQGGSAALEDAIVLARCLSRKFVNPVDRLHNSKRETMRMMHEVGEAMDQYVKERRMRVVRLSTQTYLIGSLLKPPSLLVKFACIVFLVVLFRIRNHTRYDCGLL
ncbi:hypothetical protein RHGRI_033406 [Rhododendron griersonianum]|uniref:FAD-binding domain-containing protein n=1 Tax=Rhododendron griersonianum TaxID=479676 RepID=A0AAV6I0E9_9ERIC|nr:hypothetical protein RHGRI_033406 [Rhododendron griersonianum]KAG5520826.1 hypothetical protein RHGRI_033406 [Rhododendron griersonianum]